MGVPQKPKDKKVTIRKKKKTGGYNHLSNGNGEKKKPATQLAKKTKKPNTTKKIAKATKKPKKASYGRA